MRRWNWQEGAETRGPLGYGRRGEGAYPLGGFREERWPGHVREAAGAPWRGRQWHGGESPIGAYAGRGPRNYRRSDERIQEDVSEELTRSGDLDASDIEVRVENGEVTLTGTVESRQDKRLAEDIADRCSGVQEVHNQLRVKHRVAGRSQGEQSESGREGGKARGR